MAYRNPKRCTLLEPLRNHQIFLNLMVSYQHGGVWYKLLSASLSSHPSFFDSWYHQPPGAGSNRFFQVLDLLWRSQGSGSVWYKSRHLNTPICPPSEGWWYYTAFSAQGLHARVLAGVAKSQFSLQDSSNLKLTALPGALKEATQQSGVIHRDGGDFFWFR